MTPGAATWIIIGTVLAVGAALATLILRLGARGEAERRAFQAEAAADRRRAAEKMAAWRAQMQTSP